MKTYLSGGNPTKKHRTDEFVVAYAVLITIILALVIAGSVGACIDSNRRLNEAAVEKKLLEAEVRRLENQLNGCAAELQIYRAGGTPE